MLFYPLTSVFLYSSDVTRPGGFKEISREAEQQNILTDYYATRLDAEHAAAKLPDVILQM